MYELRSIYILIATAVAAAAAAAAAAVPTSKLELINSEVHEMLHYAAAQNVLVDWQGTKDRACHTF